MHVIIGAFVVNARDYGNFMKFFVKFNFLDNRIVNMQDVFSLA